MSASQRSSGNSATGATCWKPALAIDRVEAAEALERGVDGGAVAARASVRSAANGDAGAVVVGLEVDGEHVEAVVDAGARAIARPIPLAAPVTIALRTRPEL